MDLSTNDKKRRRLDSGDSFDEGSGRQQTTLDGVQRDQEVWLPDGNIVVTAQKVAFRIHKSVLALHSEVFRDLFVVSSSASTASDPMEMIDDCPVVKLPDNSIDLRHLFLVLCCGKNYYYRDDEPQVVPFAVLDSLIRMGYKYCVRTVLRDALARLQKYYTNDASTWFDDARRVRYVTAPEPSSAIQTINSLAPLTDTPSLLPTAFLTCCDLFESVVEEVAGAPGGFGMSTDDFLRVVNGRAALTRTAANHIVGLATAVEAHQPYHPYQCMCAAFSVLAAHERNSSLDEMQKHTMAFVPLYERFWKPNQPCQECLAATKRKDEERCRQSWLQLPAVFNIEVPGWPDRTELPT
ncbi:hypothetical protein GSI_04747 [Ganoderma sinense ZZ0214-1]|uniref:BTB domain-containing protein n=1 Tax=Ganoderma sinense ZZ0214-1 TaxID=1077348 RepID=A0A2G8SHV0_9APHY|nr:hypothetical protein GSI_04747 [Ganoderma sinense ZZ0214-1]